MTFITSNTFMALKLNILCIQFFFRDSSSNTMRGTCIIPVNQFLENIVERKLRAKFIS